MEIGFIDDRLTTISFLFSSPNESECFRDMIGTHPEI